MCHVCAHLCTFMPSLSHKCEVQPALLDIFMIQEELLLKGANGRVGETFLVIFDFFLNKQTDMKVTSEARPQLKLCRIYI